MAETFTGVKLKGELGRFGKTEICDVLGVYPMPDEKVKITLHYKKLFRNAGTSPSLYVFISSGIFLRALQWYLSPHLSRNYASHNSLSLYLLSLNRSDKNRIMFFY